MFFQLRYGLTQLQVIYLNRVLSRFSTRLVSAGSLQTPQNCAWQGRPPFGQGVEDLERQFKTNNTGDEYGMPCFTGRSCLSSGDLFKLGSLGLAQNIETFYYICFGDLDSADYTI